jgi:hypothetical protein
MWYKLCFKLFCFAGECLKLLKIPFYENEMNDLFTMVNGIKVHVIHTKQCMRQLKISYKIMFEII